ncbi:MAG: DNA cytosine methyltransferase [Sediminibacterium sp.]|nr:DNA cytosine methyltransferase [Sediminibacterium sp.]
MEKWRKDNQRFFTPHWIPEKTKNGIDWLKWCSKICSLGYRDDWKQMNSANFGAYTSRNRLFGVFAKKGLPIVWPSVTHAKNPEKTFVGGRQLKKWNAVKDLLDFSNEGKTIFNRKKPLETTTMERLFKGSVKHIAGGKDAFDQAFISRYYSGNPEHRNHTVDEPAGTITTNNRLAIVSHSFISKYFSGHPESKSSSINTPASTIKPKDNQALVNTVSFIDQRNGGNLGHKSRSIDLPSKTLTQSGGNQQLVNADVLQKIDKIAENSLINFPLIQNLTHDKFGNPCAHFLQKYYSNGGQFNSINEPAATISTRDRLSKVSAQFIDRQFSQGKQNQTIDEPLGAITTVPKANYIQADFFIDKQYTGVENNQPITQPAGTITTNDKHCLIHAEKWLMNTNFNNVGSSLEGPAPVITASRHHHYIINPENNGQSMGHLIVAIDHFRTPLYYIVGEGSPIIVPVYDGDCEWTIKLKEFMVLFQIVDIKMRMLVIEELIQIQGFPKDYIMIGSNTDKKKFIGNSVVPAVVEHWILAYSQAVFADEYERFKIAA